MGPIAPPTRYGQKRYMLVATDYATKWTEAAATKTSDASIVAQFFYENIISRYGCPKELISDRGTYFLNKTIDELTTRFFIKHQKTSPYHPCVSRQTGKINSIFCGILTKTITGSLTNWDDKLWAIFWAYRTVYKVTT